MDEKSDSPNAARERVAASLEKLIGFGLISPQQQKLIRVSLQMREMYPQGDVSGPTEKAMACFSFVTRVENELTLARGEQYSKTHPSLTMTTAFRHRAEERFSEGRGNTDKLVAEVREFGYPSVVTFNTSARAHMPKHIAIVLGEEDGEPIIVDKDASDPFQRIPFREIFEKYDAQLSAHTPAWVFGIRKMHKKDTVIEPAAAKN